MKKIKTHTGLLASKDKNWRVSLYETPTAWCIRGQECYSKNTGRRCGSHDSLSRLLLDSIKPVE
ncbi:hypothetical protein N2M14_003761 [Escherichia coli]|nr:hypothetical protein [Escherichia coli]EJT3541638.1 hypothetical protein [Escherichia coli]